MEVHCSLMLILLWHATNAFVLSPTCIARTSQYKNFRSFASSSLTGSSSSSLLSSSSSSGEQTRERQRRRMGELTPPENRVYHLMEEIHDSGFPFRVVVVGRGAILETTAVLGPVARISQSPTTGANLLTLANDDQSFEFHLQLSEVSKMTLVPKETPKKVLRIVRLLNASGETVCSLILASEEESAVRWYEGLIDRHGNEIQL